MDQNKLEDVVCEACGFAGEMGFIIKEGDDVAEVTVFAPNGELLQQEFDKYVELAKQVSSEVQYEVTPVNPDSTELKGRFKFEVSAEKMIFELKTRSLVR
ncbi:YfcZ/YiiS family protein [Vibrio sp.]|uniref:YfcZ/YiiS family protein n=1 Tax=Vibrio sp. TaxID=678 RepID=UPI003D133660